ncbi:MAG TPA: BTAD domain-containing putative transcriptional regulator, partial [Solirubrobacteraceae bacterium]|nr:BTAD domain-containing putative transcriptional regulator [Solirubrobacteraceae bacterium]
MERVTVHLLGRFAVDVDGRPLPDDAFAQRRAADLVKVLALAPGHRLSRDRVVEMLWPRLPADAGTANLHKAAHYARRALGARDAIVLRQGSVELAPSARVETDAERFERDAEAPYGGELLPDDRYEDWAVGPRERLRDLRIQRLRAAGRWADVVAEDPADEQAHRELMQADLAAGDRLAAARRFRLLRDELGRLGLRPSSETLELERRLAEGPPVRAARAPGAPVVGRDAELAHVVHALRGATEGDGAALVVCADAGMGKTR